MSVFDEHEGGQLRLQADGDQLALVPLPDARIAESDGSDMASVGLLEAVRAALAAGVRYDVDLNACAAEALGVEVTRELGTAVYRAKNAIRDEEKQAEIDELLACGWRFACDVEIVQGARFMLRTCTLYVGSEVRTYHDPRPVRAEKRGSSLVASGGWVFVPRGCRSKGWPLEARMLVLEGWS